jgi:hypothetical protein
LYGGGVKFKDTTVRGFRSSLSFTPPPRPSLLGFHRAHLSLRDQTKTKKWNDMNQELNITDSKQKRLDGLRRYWEDIRAGRRSPPRRDSLRKVTTERYGYCAERRRKRLVVTLEQGDIIRIREQHRRENYTARLWDVYVWLIRCTANARQLERARQRKAAKAERLARQRQARAEKRLFKS